MSHRQIATLVILSGIWGASFMLIKVALQTIPPLTLVLGRTAVAAGLLYLVVRLRGMKMPEFGGIWIAFLLMGLLNGAIPYTLISWGEIYIDSALAAILNALMPVFTVVLAHFMTRDERFTVRKAVGVGLGLAGVVVLMGPAALMGLGTSVLAQLAVTGAAVCYSVAAIYGKALSKTSSLILATGQMIGASAIMLPFSLVLEKPWTLSPSLLSTVSLTCLSVFGTALAYIFYYRLLGQIGATNLSLVTYLIPLTGVFLGVLVLGERLHWTAFAALGLILSSVAVAGGFADPTSKIGKSSSTFQVKPADNKLDS